MLQPEATRAMPTDIKRGERENEGAQKEKMEGEDEGNACVSPRKFRMWRSRVEEKRLQTER